MGSTTWRSDRELAQAYLDGNPQAVAAIERVVRASLGGFRTAFAADLDDIVQEILLEVTIALRERRYRGDGVLAAYVSRLARFHAIDRWRKRRVRHWVELDELGLPASDPLPSQQVEQRDRVRGLLSLFRAMPEECQRLWRMLVRGASYRQMSEKLGVSEGALRVRVLRCRKRAQAHRDREEV